MVVEFYDEELAHASYGVVSRGQMAVIDPGRNPEAYYEMAKKLKATITMVAETHLHADFISSHSEISRLTEANIFISSIAKAKYPHVPFDDGAEIILGAFKLKAINTPGHSPESICIVLEDEKGNDYAVFTGDTLFVGDVGRPDLRNEEGTNIINKEKSARALFHSLHQKVLNLNDKVLVYPAHGAGSLCGKNLSSERHSTIGKEKAGNIALQIKSEEEFIKFILKDQPFVPKYFPNAVEINQKGAEDFSRAILQIPVIETDFNAGKRRIDS
jgi:hydroxyacylglutathione hydrolase